MSPDCTSQVNISIGGTTIAIRAEDASFLTMLRKRYAKFVVLDAHVAAVFDVELKPREAFDRDADAEVSYQNGIWLLTRGDFRAEWNLPAGTGRICQSASPYSIDTAIRIVHTILLAQRGGFLLHSSSLVRNGKAFLFAGVSGSGKTTISRLAPDDAILLTDEISYVTPAPSGYQAFGTPFAGDLGRPGEQTSSPIGALFFLSKGQENRIDRIESAEALREIMKCVLFFAREEWLVDAVFQAACAFVTTVPAYRLYFLPDRRVWDLIR